MFKPTSNIIGFSANSTERMRIDTSGNVGIGTTSLYGGTGVTALTIGSTQYPSLALQVNGTNAHIITGYSNNLSFDAVSTRYIRFNTNGVERMRIDGSTKNVGIGTSTFSTITTGVATLSLGGTNSGISGGIAYQTNGTPEAYHYTQDDMLLHQAVTGVGQRFLTNNTERMRIKSDGKVGIGTTAPTETLTVLGAIATKDGSGDLATHNQNSHATPVASGSIEFTAGYSGTLASGRVLTFTYEATSWKSWIFEIEVASTHRLTTIKAGGYNNNSMSSNIYEVGDANNGGTLTVTNSGQHNVFTFTVNTGMTHPVLRVKYTQSGGDGAPRMDRMKLVIT